VFKEDTAAVMQMRRMAKDAFVANAGVRDEARIGMQLIGYIFLCGFAAVFSCKLTRTHVTCS
jgi:hypothetical protein